MKKKITLLIYFLCLAPQLSFGKSSILDNLIIEEARMNTPTQNRSIIHNTVSSPSLYTAKVFNSSAKKYITKFKDSPVYLIDAIIDEVLYRIKIKELVIYTNTQPEPTNFLYLRIYPNSPMFIMRKDNARFNKVEINGVSANYELLGTLLEIELPQPLRQNESVNLYMEFSELLQEIVPPSDNLFNSLDPTASSIGGFVDYGVFGYYKEIISLGHWFPMLTPYKNGEWSRTPPARNGDIQNFEEGIFKINFTTDNDTVIASAGVKIGEKASEIRGKESSYIGIGMRECAFQLSKNFKVIKKSVGDTIIESYFLEGHDDFGKSILSYTAKALKLYGNLIGEYPYTELKVVETYLTGGAGGMEFPAFITISSYYHNPKINLGPMGILFGNKNKEIEESLRPLLQSTLEFIVAHEVAHQWWNTVVGSDSINSAWIDESLTNYFALIYFDKIYGRERFEEQKLYNLRLPILLAKFAGISDKGVNRPSSEFTDTMQYAVVIYSKGAYFYDELSQLLGEDNFLKTARAYYNKYKFSFAPEEGFINVAKKENPKFKSKIDALYRRWIIEEHMYEDIKGNFIEEVAKMAGVRIPKVVDFDKGLFNSFKDIMRFGSKK